MGKRNLALRANIDAQRAVGNRFYGPKAAEFRLVDIKGFTHLAIDPHLHSVSRCVEPKVKITIRVGRDDRRQIDHVGARRVTFDSIDRWALSPGPQRRSGAKRLYVTAHLCVVSPGR